MKRFVLSPRLILYASVGAAGAILYPVLEILWRARTHPSMALAGGICALLICYVSDRFRMASLPLRALACAALITLVELVFGIVCNLILGLGVWDYSGMPGAVLGQVCLPYSVLWFFLALPLTLLFTGISDRFHA